MHTAAPQKSYFRHSATPHPQKKGVKTIVSPKTGVITPLKLTLIIEQACLDDAVGGRVDGDHGEAVHHEAEAVVGVGSHAQFLHLGLDPLHARRRCAITISHSLTIIRS